MIAVQRDVNPKRGSPFGHAVAECAMVEALNDLRADGKNELARLQGKIMHGVAVAPGDPLNLSRRKPACAPSLDTGFSAPG